MDFFKCSDYKAQAFFFAVSCLHAHLRVFPACSFNFRTLVKIHKPPHYEEGTSLLHTKVANNHYTLQVRVCLYWGFTPTDEQANAMTQQAECTRGTICLHQLQRTNYPDYRVVWVYMSVCVHECVFVSVCSFICVPTVCLLMLRASTVSLYECVCTLRYVCVLYLQMCVFLCVLTGK